MKVPEVLGRVFPHGRPRAVTNALLVVRRQLDHQRPLPDFLIIGAQRSGTSSLYKYLQLHPAVVASLRKETHYFSHHYLKGEEWYRSHFPSRWYRDWVQKRRGWKTWTFEATPLYLFHPWAAKRAFELLGGTRIVAVLRNPVDRAFSHYHHSVRHGWETLSFTDAVAAEPIRLAGCAERLMADPSYRSKEYLRFSYLARGFYAEQLERWMAHFPRERVLVLRSEDLFDRTLETYHALLDFLGLPSWSPPELTNHSYRGLTQPQSHRMDSALRDQLVETFVPHNRRLSVLLGRDFGWDR